MGVGGEGGGGHASSCATAAAAAAVATGDHYGRTPEELQKLGPRYQLEIATVLPEPASHHVLGCNNKLELEEWHAALSRTLSALVSPLSLSRAHTDTLDGRAVAARPARRAGDGLDAKGAVRARTTPHPHLKPHPPTPDPDPDSNPNQPGPGP